MFTVTPRANEKEVLDKTCTIDAAIISARHISKTSIEVIVVRGDGRIRVMAVFGRAHWVVPCKPCKGKGTIDVIATWGGNIEPCEYCSGAGVVNDLQCE